MKRVLAVICMLALLLGFVPVSVPQVHALEITDASAEPFQVGYARVDINPYVVEDDPSSGIMALPLRGEGDVWNRLSENTLLDDNADGVVDENDGLKATCIAISDDEGKTVLMITMDLVGGIMTDQVRPAIIERVNTAIDNGALTDVQKLTSADIYCAGTHTHNAPDVGAYLPNGKTGTNDAGVDLSVVNENLGIWIERTVEDVCDAAILALEDRSAAQLKKDQLSAGEATSPVLQDKSLITTRHYNTDVDGVEFVAGDGFNAIKASDYANPSDYRTTRGISPKQVTVADDNIYLLLFAFEDGAKLPIILTSWRGHPSLNNRTGFENSSKTAISSDYINAYRHALEYGCDVTYNTANGYLTDWTLGTTRKYRVAFFAGTGGNINTRNYEQITYHGTDGDVLQRGFSWIEGSAKNARIKGCACSFGVALATLAQECLDDGLNETPVNGGKVQTAQINYYAARKTTGITQLSYNAALACQAAMEEGTVTYPYRYTDPETGECFIIGGRFHPSGIIRSWSKSLGAPITTPIKVELGSILLGQDVAFVSVPAEPFDYYYKDTTLTGDAKFAPENNLWNELINPDTYGKPFVLGYCNGLLGYLPNYEAYIYGEGSTEWTVGSYEAYTTNFEQGTGENMVRTFDRMLTAMSENGGMTYTASCAHCGENQVWEPYNAQATLTTGHYYLCTDTQTAQIKISGGQTVCIDLNGCTLTGETRALYTSDTARDTLNIMDSSPEQTGVIQGRGASCGAGVGFGGRTIIIAADDELNLYSGTLTCAEQTAYSVASGGVLRILGTFNMYGGKVIGGTASSFTGSYLSGGTVKTSTRTGTGGSIALTGTMNLYGGEISGGKLTAIIGTVTQNESGTNVYSQTSEVIEGSGSCVWVAETGVVNLSGNASVEQLHFADDDGLNVIGSYTGSAELKFDGITELTDLTKIGNALTGENGVPATTCYATITFADAPAKTAAVRGADLVVSDMPYTYGNCEACGECRWVPVTDAQMDAWGRYNMPPGHYVLTENITTLQKQLNYNGDLPGSFCIDLAGHTFTGATRAFIAQAGSRLNIYDSVGGGIVEGHISTGSGGVIFANQGDVHLYGGTLRHTNAMSESILSGGAVRVAGSSFHLHGGVVIGFPVSTYGGAIYVTNTADAVGSFVASGGQVISGKATTAGDCVYAAEGSNISISDEANVERITFASESFETLNIDGNYTGTVELEYPEGIALSDGSVLGNVTSSGDLHGASISVKGLSCLRPKANSGKLILNTDPNLHTYQTEIKRPTCTVKGYTTYTCSCGYSYISDETSALGHSYDTVVADATCTDRGTVTKTCTACGDIQTQVIPATGHRYQGGVCTSCRSCEACGECQWISVDDAQLDAWGKYGMMPGHYVLTEDVKTDQKQLNSDGLSPGSYCIDLNGYDYVGNTRSFLVYPDARLNVMDSAGNGKLTGQMLSGSGGVIYSTGGQVHLYGGTVQQLNTKTDILKSGGAISINSGVLQIHGGTVMGFDVSDFGGAIFLNNGAAFFADGGQILSGNAATAGDCVYISQACSATLSGDVQISELAFATMIEENLTVDGGYTGEVALHYPAQSVLIDGAVLGRVVSGDLAGATITMQDLDCYAPIVKDGSLVLKCIPDKHSYISAVIEPTCTEKGYTTYTCACGDTYTADEVAALGHSYKTVTADPTCTGIGSITHTCATCGDTKVETIPATGHSHKAVVTAPTCTEKGYTTYTCECGDSYVADEVAPTGHAEIKLPGKAATCTEAGLTEGTVCTACGETLVAQQTVPATGHRYEIVATEVTCTTEGYTTHTCSCGDSYITDRLEALGHSFDVTVVEPSCVIPGYQAHICNRCSYSFYDHIVPAVGHCYESVTVAATCTENGSVTDTCISCGDVTVEILPVISHCYEATVTEPTYSSLGYTTYTCSRCAHSYRDQYTKPIGHDYSITVISATCTTSGYTLYTCACGQSYTGSEVAALGHSFENGFCTTCGEADPDYVKPVVTPTLTLKSPTLEFKDMITVNAMFTAENIEDVVEMGMITYKTNVIEWNVETAAHVIPGTSYDAATGRYIAHSQGINAKYLGDTVHLACYAKLTDGSYVYTKLAPYSPVQYATSQLKNSTNVQLKQLVAAMLNYGAEAQLFFGHNTDNLANATLTDEQKALPEVYREDMVGAVPAASAEKQGIFANNKGFAKRYPAISFEGAFCINYFFKPNYTPVGDVTLYYWNEAEFEAAQVLTKENASGTLTLALEDSGEYRADIEGIAAKNLSEAVYVAAVYSDGTTQWSSGVLGYSIGAYCSSQSSKGAAVAALAEATAVYGYHAKQYFG